MNNPFVGLLSGTGELLIVALPPISRHLCVGGAAAGHILLVLSAGPAKFPLIFALSVPRAVVYKPCQANTTSVADDSPDAGAGTNVSAPTLPLSLLLMSDCGYSWQRG